MASATLTFDLIRIGMTLPIGLLPLATVGPSSFQGPQQFVGTESMTSSQSRVLRGLMRSTQVPSIELEAVCKYREGDISTIEHEARIYQDQLVEIQGVAVPRFYGLFKGTRYDKNGKELNVACIILEYFEEDLTWDLWKGSIKTRGEIAVAMLKIHFSGLRHCAFEDNHVLVSADGQVRIVDFARACGHDCDASPEIDVWEWEPSRSDYGCNEMFDIMQQLALWTPVFVRFMGTYVHIFSYSDYKDLAQWYLGKLPYSPKPDVVEQVTQSAKEALERFYARYEERFPRIGDPRVMKDEYVPKQRAPQEEAGNEEGP